ncbi:cupin domain-containing protein [Trichothermofontia sp.]
MVQLQDTSSRPIVAPNLEPVAATELRPWGSFTVLEEGRGYKIKRIEVKPGHRLSLQMHHHRSEHWIVVSGTARVICGDREVLLSSNQSTYVPPCTHHRLENPGVIPLILIEVQNGEYLGEDDIVRFDDDYARDSQQPNQQPHKSR